MTAFGRKQTLADASSAPNSAIRHLLDFIKSGKWREGYEASDEMLDEHAKKYGLEDQDWRKGYWDE